MTRPGPSVTVIVPSPLQSYTGAREVEAEGATVAEAVLHLDRRHPGMRFRMVDEQDRMRPHVRFFVNGEQVLDLRHPLREGDTLQIVQALSGG